MSTPSPSPSSLARKFGVRPGFSVLLINAPAGFEESMRPLPDAARLTSQIGEEFDAVIAFVGNKAEADEASPKTLAAVKPGGLLWMGYPKQSSKMTTDINRDTGWDILKGAGWRPVTQIAVDETWSALRFRPEAEVGS